MGFTTLCFSESCGFCKKCCSNIQEEDTNQTTEILRRAEDLSKIIGSNRIDKITMNYNKELKNWCKKNGYKNPNTIGRSKKTIQIQKKNKEFVNYKLIQKSHGAICDNSLCKIMYVNSTDWLHTSFYTALPIYTKSDDSFQLCGPCISRVPKEPDISTY